MNASDLEKIAAKLPLSPSTRALNAARPPARRNDAPATLTPSKRATGNQASFLNYDNHPRTQVSDSKPEHNQAPALGGAVQGKAEGVGRVLVRFVGYRVRPLDPDNFAASIKDCLDFLRHAHLIEGDEPWRIILQTEQVKVAHFAEEKTVIEVEI